MKRHNDVPKPHNSNPRKCPSHLRGSEIGLWYAAQSKLKNTKRDQAMIDELFLVGLNVQKIRNFLEENADFTKSTVQLPHKQPNQQVFYAPPVSTSVDNDSDDVEELFSEFQDTFDITGGLYSTRTIPENILKPNSALDAELCKEFQDMQASLTHSEAFKSRLKLPVYQMKDELLSNIRSNQITVISGETGCGKTTQIPQYILDDQLSNSRGSSTRIIVTQPRRISAVSVAERVANERGQSIGSSIGYQIRLESRPTQRPQGSILFCTTGIVLQWFRDDPLLKNISHIVVDEVHEREFLCDFLLCMLKRIAPLRPDLRIILMSATINSDRFVEYFNNCPKFEIRGRTYPVQTHYLEDVLRSTNFRISDYALSTLARDRSRQSSVVGSVKRRHRGKVPEENPEHQKWLKSLSGLSSNAISLLRSVGDDAYPYTDLIAHTIDHILNSTDNGAVLAFVSGLSDIKATIKCLKDLNPLKYNEQSNSVKLYALHSKLPTARDRSLFNPPPARQRKVIIATNIAETSITIEDVIYVIDSGRIKVTNFDANQNTSTLAPILISKANATQRCGRAGRVQPGVCYRLFSSYVYENVMPGFLIPEMLRVRLEDVILRIKLLDLGCVTEFLSSCIDSPSETAVKQTIIFLRQISALKLLRNNQTTSVDNNNNFASKSVEKDERLLLKNYSRAMKDAYNETHQLPLSGDINSTVVSSSSSSSSATKAMLPDSDYLTSLGVHLANLPLDPQCAKLLIFGAIFSCLEPALAIAASLTYRDPFEIPLERQEDADKKRLELAEDSLSDHWVYANAIYNYQNLNSNSERRNFCQKYYLNERVMRDLMHLMRDFARLLYEHKFIRTPDPRDKRSNLNQWNMRLVRGILSASFYPNIIRAVPKHNKNGKLVPPRIIGPPTEGRLEVHLKSVNGKISIDEPVWMTFFTKTKLEPSNHPTIFDTTIISPRALALFSGEILTCKSEKSIFKIDEWIQFRTEPKFIDMIKNIRSCLDAFLENKFKYPGPTDWDESTREGRLLNVIHDILTHDSIPNVQQRGQQTVARRRH